MTYDIDAWCTIPISDGSGRPILGVRIPTTATYRGWRLDCIWEMIGGRLEPFEVTIQGDGGWRVITADAIRKIPLGAMLRKSRAAVRNEIGRLRETSPETIRELDEFGALDELASGAPQRGRALTPDDLQQVADVYRRAWRDGEPVNARVREAFHLSQSAAAKRIQRARAAGLLDGIGPTR